MSLHLLQIIVVGIICVGLLHRPHAQASIAGTQWRANQESLSDEAQLYSSRLPLKVNFLGNKNDFLKWEAPAHCAASSKYEIESEINCETAGLHKVKLKYLDDGEVEEASRVLIMKKSPLCYKWYFLTLKGSRAENVTQIVIRIWVWDPLHASSDEIKLTATAPTLFSRTLSKVFAAKNQEPTLAVLDPDPRIVLDWANFTFIQSQGLWEFYVHVPQGYIPTIQVKGKPNTAAHGCFIRDTKTPLSWPHNDEIKDVLQAEGSVTLRGQPGITKVIKDPCYSETAFLIMGEKCVLTLDGFKTSFDIRVPSNLISDESQEVKGIAITSGYMIYLLREGSLLAQNRTTGTFVVLNDDEPVTAIQGKDSCQYSQLREHENDMFIAWKDVRLYIWQGNELNKVLEVNKEQLSGILAYPFWMNANHIEVSIAYATFTSEPQELFVLIRLEEDNQAAYAIVGSQLMSGTWNRAWPFFFQQISGGDSSVSLTQMPGSEQNIILWDQNHVFYSYSWGSNIGEMPLLNGLESETKIKPAIKQVTVTVKGFILVISSHNVLYTSQGYQHFLIKHTPLASTDSDLAVYTNQLDEMYFLQFKGSELERIGYSLKPEIKTIVDQIDPGLCSYIHFRQGPQFRIYYLDLRDSATFWSEVVYSADKYNNIKTVITRSDTLNITEEVMTDFYPGRKSIKKIVTIESSFSFAHPASYQEVVTSATGFITMEMRPERIGVGCRSPHKMVSQLEMGCPPNRHIRVQKPSSCQSVGSFTINKNVYMLSNGQPPETDLVTEYDELVYGCPMRQMVDDTIKPVIELYDNNVLVEQMTANFVMWEDNGRQDFGYTATMMQAGCLQESQTWEKMIDRNDTNPDSPFREIWGRHNYESCFTYEVTELELLRQPYQVLNRSGENSLRWLSTGENQIFLFSLHVIDPHYSFCGLEAKVGVVVSKRTLFEGNMNAMLRICIGTFAALTGAILIATYLIYRRSHMRDIALELQDHYVDETGQEDDERDDEEEQE